MGKIGQIAIVVAIVVVAYLFLLVAMPILTEFASAANTTMQATSNMSQYPGTAEAVVATPWVLFFVPGVIGIGAIVIILRQP